LKECLDTSVIVKWFKEHEAYEKEANYLLRQINALESEFIINEWVLFEMVRALVKSKYSKDRIVSAIEYVDGLVEVGALRSISVSEVKDMAQRFQIEYSLYASDAVHLATAVQTSSNIFWVMDEHFTNPKISKMAVNYGVEVRDLSEVKIE